MLRISRIVLRCEGYHQENKAHCFGATCILLGSTWAATLNRAVNKEGCQLLRRRFETEFVGGHDAHRKRRSGNRLLRRQYDKADPERPRHTPLEAPCAGMQPGRGPASSRLAIRYSRFANVECGYELEASRRLRSAEDRR